MRASQSVAAILALAGAVLVNPARAGDLPPSATLSGPDVLVGDIVSSGNGGTTSVVIPRLAVVGGDWVYGVGTVMCNSQAYYSTFGKIINPAPMNVLSDAPSVRQPFLTHNLYRFDPATGRLEQLGYSWVKPAGVSLSVTLCNQGCQATNGAALGVNCSSPNSASASAGTPQTLLPRSSGSAFDGRFASVGPASSPAIVDGRSRRLFASASDLAVPGATYVLEAMVLGPDDAAFGNGWNNASHRVVNSINPTTGAIVCTAETDPIAPAIYAWRSLTGGEYSPVVISRVAQPTIFPARFSTWNTAQALSEWNIPSHPSYLPAAPVGDGELIVGSNVINEGPGLWRYEYAVFNLSSHRSAGGLQVPLPPGASVSSVTYRPVLAHSGEPAQDARRNTPWSTSSSGASVRWERGAAFDPAQPNVNNAIEWGTMWNFSFVCDVPPISRGSLTIEHYAPAPANDPLQPGTLSARAWTPDPAWRPVCRANCDASLTPPVLNALDFGCFLQSFVSAQSLASSAQQVSYANCDGSTTPPVLNALDFSCYLGLYVSGCP